MSIIEQSGEVAVAEKPGGIGCVYVMLGINAILIGLLAFSFSHGPYSSREQELWYRYGPLGFLLAGVILPTIAFRFGVLRSQRAVVGLLIWMIATLMACLIYALFSGGGI
ncbi:hypothetical protein LWE61_02290 [Sphingobium sufflavum]|uniref:hypothetical protein n=1 Tax=Sphingobium sufflavum TaxID=1129547 RepID=UPI001F3ECCDA|nr:hypothetical protein [Sphingobium sufflavum]MCE7795381.1 hypothetical protein [Sphingobium sufflavum]